MGAALLIPRTWVSIEWPRRAAAFAHLTGNQSLEKYETALKASWIYEELKRVRNIRPGFKHGLWQGMLYAVFLINNAAVFCKVNFKALINRHHIAVFVHLANAARYGAIVG